MMKNLILEKIRTFDVNEQTLKNTVNILDMIPIEFISLLELDDVYKTNYGTIIMDWDKSENHFQLEVGKTDMGYFSEKNGKDLFLRENKTTVGSINMLISDMNLVFL